LSGAYIYGDWQLGTFWSVRVGEKPRELCRSSLLPVGFGIDPGGELLICDHAGGGLWRLAHNPAASQPAKFPQKLSETGLFRDVAKQIPADGVLPYEVNVERWADGAKGERWVAMPGTGKVAVADKELGVLERGRWLFPEGTVFAKTYSVGPKDGQASASRRVETQMLYFDGLQWGAYGYRWNDSQTDADLVPARGIDEVLEIKDTASPGGIRRVPWRYFSRVECSRCHNMRENFAPGFSALQLDRPASGGNQLALLTAIGCAAGRSTDPKTPPPLAAPQGSTGSLELRARSYLHANCSSCHRFGGGGSVPSLMNLETPLVDARLIDSRPVQGDLGLPEGRIIAAGDPARSVLLYRMSLEGRGHMPYLGSKEVDERGVLLIRDWIAGVSGNDDLPSAVRQQRDAEKASLARLQTGDVSQLDGLLQTASGALSVAFGILDGSLHGDLRKQAVTRGSQLVDPLRRGLFERFLPEDQRRKVLGSNFRPDALLAMKGDAARGQRIFAGLCAACHRVGDAGVDFGPELTRIGTKYARPALLEQILQPAKVIDAQWQWTTISLKSGESLGGFVAARDGADLTLKMPGGVTRKIAGADIDKSSTERISLMPEGLLQGMTAQEAADLLEYVSSRK
jgi:putative heme-binding domain-containing protein